MNTRKLHGRAIATGSSLCAATSRLREGAWAGTPATAAAMNQVYIEVFHLLCSVDGLVRQPNHYSHTHAYLCRALLCFTPLYLLQSVQHVAELASQPASLAQYTYHTCLCRPVVGAASDGDPLHRCWFVVVWLKRNKFLVVAS